MEVTPNQSLGRLRTPVKFLHTLFDKYLDHMLVKFEQNRMVRITQNFEFFNKNISCSLDHTIMFKFPQHPSMWFKYVSNNDWRDYI